MYRHEKKKIGHRGATANIAYIVQSSRHDTVVLLKLGLSIAKKITQLY